MKVVLGPRRSGDACRRRRRASASTWWTYCRLVSAGWGRWAEAQSGIGVVPVPVRLASRGRWSWAELLRDGLVGPRPAHRDREAGNETQRAAGESGMAEPNGSPFHGPVRLRPNGRPMAIRCGHPGHPGWILGRVGDLESAGAFHLSSGVGLARRLRTRRESGRIPAAPASVHRSSMGLHRGDDHGPRSTCDGFHHRYSNARRRSSRSGGRIVPVRRGCRPHRYGRIPVWGADQYADVPVGAFLAGAMAGLTQAGTSQEGVSRTRVLLLTGLMLGLAGWTKNEGVAAAAIAILVHMAVQGVRSGRVAALKDGAWILLGALPSGAAWILQHVLLAPITLADLTTGQTTQSIWLKLGDTDRWYTVLTFLVGASPGTIWLFRS